MVAAPPPPKVHPLSEMAIAVQFADRARFTPEMAFNIFALIKSEFPGLDLAPKIGVLGGQQQLVIENPGTQLQPRWMYTSANQALLMQVQDDLVGFNWRRTTPVAAEPYNGYKTSVERLKVLMDLWAKEVNGGNLPAISTCHLYYDNIWQIEEPVLLGNIFSFWKPIGVSGRYGGPEIKWQIMLDNDALTPASRLDLNAGIGAAQVGPSGEVVKVARLALGTFGYLSEQDKLWDAFEAMHDSVHEYLKLLVAEDMRGAWDV